jgi:hypothetical protein
VSMLGLLGLLLALQMALLQKAKPLLQVQH